MSTVPLPSAQLTELQSLSSQGLLNGVSPTYLELVDLAESGGNPGPYNSSGYGGYFGTSQSETGVSNPTSIATFAQQAEAASSVFAAGLKASGGNPIGAEAYYQTGSASNLSSSGPSIFESYLGGPPQARGISTQMGGPGGNAATGAQSAGTVGGQSWALSLQNVLNPASSGILGTSSTIAEWGARLGLVAVGLILFLGGLAVIGVSSLLPRAAGKIPPVAAVKRAVA